MRKNKLSMLNQNQIVVKNFKIEEYVTERKTNSMALSMKLSSD